MKHNAQDKTHWGVLFLSQMCVLRMKNVFLWTFEKHTFATKIKHPDEFHAFLNKHFCALCVLSFSLIIIILIITNQFYSALHLRLSLTSQM